jgi:hypothetical protein
MGKWGMNMKKTGLGVFAPAAYTNNDDYDDSYNPRTVTLGGNDPMLNKVDAIFDDLSGEYSLDFRGNAAYSATLTIGVVFPLSPADLRGEGDGVDSFRFEEGVFYKFTDV